MSYDKAARPITVSDNGIGMSRQEVIDHIGTIAKSGTREFFEQLDADSAKDAQLIGQFGVGFYSSFIVADQVTLVTRRAGSAPAEGVRWESDGEGDYTVEPTEKATRGTDVILHLRPERGRPAVGHEAAAILRKYSDHITVPDRDEEGAVGRRRQGAGDDRRGRAGQPGLRAVGATEVARSATSSTRSSTSTSRTTSSRRWPGAMRESKVARSSRSCSSSRGERHSTSGIATIATAMKLYVRRVFIMDDAEQAAARVPAVRARRRRLERSAAQRLARDPAGVGDVAQIRTAVGQARARRAGGSGGKAGREVRHVLDRVRPCLQGGRRRGRPQPRADCEAASVCFARTTVSRSRRCRSPTTWAG